MLILERSFLLWIYYNTSLLVSHEVSTITHVGAREIKSKLKRKLSYKPSTRLRSRTRPRDRSRITNKIRTRLIIDLNIRINLDFDSNIIQKELKKNKVKHNFQIHIIETQNFNYM